MSGGRNRRERPLKETVPSLPIFLMEGDRNSREVWLTLLQHLSY